MPLSLLDFKKVKGIKIRSFLNQKTVCTMLSAIVLSVCLFFCHILNFFIIILFERIFYIYGINHITAMSNAMLPDYKLEVMHNGKQL